MIIAIAVDITYATHSTHNKITRYTPSDILGKNCDITPRYLLFPLLYPIPYIEITSMELKTACAINDGRTLPVASTMRQNINPITAPYAN